MQLRRELEGLTNGQQVRMASAIVVLRAAYSNGAISVTKGLKREDFRTITQGVKDHEESIARTELKVELTGIVIASNAQEGRGLTVQKSYCREEDELLFLEQKAKRLFDYWGVVR